ncbi:MAG: hypothetical protein GX657_15180, partial [Chloroflexi bacterium]|nr:hypothetical protein [Chloroflexota bacterium]
PTAAPSATPTQTPPSTAAPTAAPTVVPTRTLAPVWGSGWYPSPLLVSPQPRETFAAGEPVILSWEPAGELRAGVFYVITLAYRYGGRTVYDDVPWLTETSWDVTEHEYLRDLAERGQFYWSLTLMRQTGFDAEGKPVGTAISPMSEVRMFTWEPASGG